MLPSPNKTIDPFFRIQNRRQLRRIRSAQTVLVHSQRLRRSESAAILRDISAIGAYFQTSLPLVKGEPLELLLEVGYKYFSFTGTVVRIEKQPASNSVGVAVSFAGSKELGESSGRA